MPRIITGLALIAVFAIAGCRAAPMYSPSELAFVNPPTTVQKVLTLEDYKNAIIRGGSKRGWTFQEEAPGHLIGSVAVRNKHSATVDILFDTKNFTISYKSSLNLNYYAKRKEIHPKYNTWVRFLQDDIQAEITQLKAS
jgi:hypothetical protein